MKLLSLISLLLHVGCSGGDTFSKSEIYKLGTAITSDLELVIPKDIASGVTCANYGGGCIAGFEVKHKGLSMIFVEYETHEDAVRFGRPINAFVSKNWVFDDVAGEPVLEDFVRKAFKAYQLKSTDSSHLE